MNNKSTMYCAFDKFAIFSELYSDLTLYSINPALVKLEIRLLHVLN